MELKSLNIPTKFEDFSKAVAALADAHGIKVFTMSIKPEFLDFPIDQHVSGDLLINYSSKDGRGRPRKKLTMQLDARLTHYLQNDPDSFN